MIHELYRRLVTMYGEQKAAEILSTSQPTWREPVELSTVRYDLLNEPFAKILQFVESKSIGVEEVWKASRYQVENQPSTYKLGFFHYEDLHIDELYASVRSYTFRSMPHSWLNFTGTVDIPQAKGYQKIKNAKQSVQSLTHISQDSWVFVRKNTILQTREQSFQIEFVPFGPFNQLELFARLEGIPYIIVSSITADGLELLRKPVMLSDTVKILFGRVEAERIVVRCEVPENLRHRRIDQYRIEFGDQIASLNSYERFVRLQQVVPVKHDSYRLKLAQYELSDARIYCRVYDGVDVVYESTGELDLKVRPASSTLRIVAESQNNEFETPLFRQLFVGGGVA